RAEDEAADRQLAAELALQHEPQRVVARPQAEPCQREDRLAVAEDPDRRRLRLALLERPAAVAELERERLARVLRPDEDARAQTRRRPLPRQRRAEGFGDLAHPPYSRSVERFAGSWGAAGKGGKRAAR